MWPMKHRSHVIERYPHSGTITLGYFCAKRIEQGFYVSPGNIRRCRLSKNNGERLFVFTR